jgi:hypothetical protein
MNTAINTPIEKSDYNSTLDSIIEILSAELNLLERVGVERSNDLTLSVMTEIFEVYNIDEEYFSKSINTPEYGWFVSEFFEENKL